MRHSFNCWYQQFELVISVIRNADINGMPVDVIYLDFQKAFDKVHMWDYYIN